MCIGAIFIQTGDFRFYDKDQLKRTWKSCLTFSMDSNFALHETGFCFHIYYSSAYPDFQSVAVDRGIQHKPGFYCRQPLH